CFQTCKDVWAYGSNPGTGWTCDLNDVRDCICGGRYVNAAQNSDVACMPDWTVRLNYKKGDSSTPICGNVAANQTQEVSATSAQKTNEVTHYRCHPIVSPAKPRTSSSPAKSGGRVILSH